MGEKKYSVTISDAKRIPNIGKGPIKNPIIITEKQYNLLTLLGYHVNVINTELKKKEIVNNDETLTEDKPDITEEEIAEDNEEVIINESSNEEDINNDVEEEIDSSYDEQVSEYEEESYDNNIEDINSLTKKQLKEKLDELEVSYPNNANAKTLRNLLLEHID